MRGRPFFFCCHVCVGGFFLRVAREKCLFLHFSAIIKLTPPLFNSLNWHVSGYTIQYKYGPPVVIPRMIKTTV